MRISDWSSDVCSSDLRCHIYHTQPGAFERRGNFYAKGMIVFIYQKHFFSRSGLERLCHIVGWIHEACDGLNQGIARCELIDQQLQPPVPGIRTAILPVHHANIRELAWIRSEEHTPALP